MSSTPLVFSGVSLESLLKQLRLLSWGAADILRAYARGEQPPYGFPLVLNVEDGGDGPVTAADLAVNSWLISGLESCFESASWKVISEESVKDSFLDKEVRGADWLWILDPLDGTKDFLQGTGEYAVHLALVHKQKSVLGVVVLPEKDELWFGIDDFGAWCEDRKGQKNFVKFSERRYIKDLILVASRNHRDVRLETLLANLEIGSSRSVGSVGCKIATILRGETDIYISLSGKTAPKDWDMAAPEAILKAAGGRFTHADGIELRYNKGDFLQQGCLIASHGYSHHEICEKVLSELKYIDPEFKV